MSVAHAEAALVAATVVQPSPDDALLVAAVSLELVLSAVQHGPGALASSAPVRQALEQQAEQCEAAEVRLQRMAPHGTSQLAGDLTSSWPIVLLHCRPLACRVPIALLLITFVNSWQRLHSGSRSQVMRWSWHRQRQLAAAPTCDVPTWLVRGPLLRAKGQAVSGAPSAEWSGTAAPPVLTLPGGRGIGRCARRWGRQKWLSSRLRDSSSARRDCWRLTTGMREAVVELALPQVVVGREIVCDDWLTQQGTVC
jgi:hypothetical protein